MKHDDVERAREHFATMTTGEQAKEIHGWFRQNCAGFEHVGADGDAVTTALLAYGLERMRLEHGDEAAAIWLDETVQCLRAQGEAHGNA